MKMYAVLSLMEGFVSAVPKTIIISISKWQLSLWNGFCSIPFVLSVWMNDYNKLALFKTISHLYCIAVYMNMVLNDVLIYKICPFLFLLDVKLCTYTHVVCQIACT
jgi:hypothetical protein